MRKVDNIKNRVGERRMMKCGEKCEIVEYINNRNVTIKFLKSGELVKCTYDNFKKGAIKSHFAPTVYGIGVVGLEKTRGNGKPLKSYKVWSSMLGRCYDEKFHTIQSTYKDCIVCEEWLYYSNFKKWFEENYYDIEGQNMCLDKDILNKGNKVYSPDTCVFIPQSINSLFTKREVDRGELPIGVCWYEPNGKYKSQCNLFDIKIQINKEKHLGYYSNAKEAFNAYKKAKEENIKLVADHYKNQIPKKLYDAMCRYEVSIND